MASKSMTSTASPAAAKRPKSAIRHQIQVTFQSEASKLEFLSRLDGAKQRLFPTGGSVDNYHLLTNRKVYNGVLGNAQDKKVHKTLGRMKLDHVHYRTSYA